MNQALNPLRVENASNDYEPPRWDERGWSSPMRRAVAALAVLFSVATACTPAVAQIRPSPTVEPSTPSAVPSATQPDPTARVVPLLPLPDPEGCRGQVVESSAGEPPADPGAQTRRVLSPTDLADYLNIMGIRSLCIAPEFGAMSLNVDWNDLGDPPVAIGRMISLGFDGLSSEVSGWGRGYLLYSTYDFEVGSEYNVFATREDLAATRARSKPAMFTVDGVDGFLRFSPGLAYGQQAVNVTYVFPFETAYVAAVLALAQYDPTEVEKVILEMQAGRHADLADPTVARFRHLVASLRFE